MKLLNLTIDNFKGIAHLDLAPAGCNVNIYGDNATGKTTVFDALQWLLFGKDSQGRSDFEVKPLGPDGNPKQNGLDVTVSATLDHDGRRITLSKTMSENWTRPRGCSQPVFSGHTTSYVVDNLPLKQKQYQETIEQLIPEKRFRLLTNPYYFSAMIPWKERRDILFDIVGDVTDADVLGSSTEFAPLADALGDHSVDDYRKILAAGLKKANQELQALPIRIDEITRTITTPVDVAAAKAQVDALRMQRRTIEARLINPDTAQQEAEAARIEAEISKQKADILSKATQAKAAWDSEQRDKIDSLRAQMDAIEAGPDESAAIAIQLRQLNAQLEECRQLWVTTNNEQPRIETHCPTCRRPYENHGELQASIEHFNLHKSEKLATLSVQGQKLSGEIAELEEQHKAAMAKVNEIRAAREAIRNKIAEVRAIPYTPPTYDDSAIRALEQQKAGIMAQVAAIKAGVNQDNMAVYGQLAAIDGQIEAAMAQIAQQDRNAQAQARVTELMDSQKATAAEMEKMEHLRYLAEEFTRVKVQLLQEKADGAFMLARFKLFDQQLNGGLADACEVTVDGVPFKDLNHAMQINVGLDVIRTLGMRYGVTAPVVVDNAESVTALEPMNCQVIRLVVSENDKQLRMELE